MSSLVRRIQIRKLKKGNKHKLLVVDDRGDILGSRWPTGSRQLFFLDSGTPVYPETKHPTLQAVIAALTPRALVDQEGRPVPPHASGP